MTSVECAAQHISSALHGRSPVTYASARALACAQVYHAPAYRTLYAALMLLLCCLAIAEPPAAPAAAPLPPAALAALRALDALCLLAALGDALLQRAMVGPAWRARRWLLLKLAVVAALGANWAAVVATAGGLPYYLRALRPLLLIERLRSLRKAAGHVLAALPALLNTGAVLLAFHFFFSILAVVSFNGMDGVECKRQRGVSVPELGCSAFAPAGPATEPFACKLLFTTLSEASIHLFALGAGANFPMVLLPVYACAPASALFFAAYICVASVVLGAGAIAVAAAVSRDQLREETVRRYGRSLGGCDLAFALLTGGNLEEARGAADRLALLQPGDSLSLLFTVQRAARREGGGAPPAAQLPQLPEPRLQQASLLALFKLLRPDLPSSTVLQLADVARAHAPAQQAAAQAEGPGAGALEGQQGQGLELGEEGSLSPLALAIETARRAAFGAPGERAAAAELASCSSSSSSTGLPAAAADRGLSRAQFRVLVMALSQVRVQQKGPGAAHGVPEDAWEGGGCCRGGARGASACLRRWTGRSVAVACSPAPSSHAAAEAQDADFLDGDESGGKAAGSTLQPRQPQPPPALALAPASVQVWGERSSSSSSGGSAAAAAPPRSCCPTALSSLFLLQPSMPELPPTASALRRRAAAVVGSAGAALAIDAAILVNTVLEVYRMSVEIEGAPATATVAALLAVQRALLGVFALEFLCKVAVFGPQRLLSAGLGHKLDALIITSSLAAAFAEAAGALPASVSLYLFTLRSLRLVRYGQKLRLKVAERAGVSVLPGLSISLKALADCLPALARFLALACAAVYAFALVGAEAFGGALALDRPAVAASAYGSSSLNLGALTFDGFTNALLTVFALMQRSVAWPVLMEGCVAGTGSTWARAYFVLLQLALPALIMPLFMGLAVELFALARLSRQAVADECEGGGGSGRASGSGVLDWRQLVAASGVSFQGLLLAKDRSEAGVWEAVHRAEVARFFPEFRRA